MDSQKDSYIQRDSNSQKDRQRKRTFKETGAVIKTVPSRETWTVSEPGTVRETDRDRQRARQGQTETARKIGQPESQK